MMRESSAVLIIVVSLVPCLAFHNGIPLPQTLGKRNFASLCWVRVVSNVADSHGVPPMMHLTRRNIGALIIGAMSQAFVQSGNIANAAESDLQYWKQDAINGFANYTVGDRGIKYKDIELGLGTPPKKGDFVRFQLSAYLLDGTLASSFAGVELAQAIATSPAPF